MPRLMNDIPVELAPRVGMGASVWAIQHVQDIKHGNLRWITRDLMPSEGSPGAPNETSPV